MKSLSEASALVDKLKLTFFINSAMFKLFFSWKASRTSITETDSNGNSKLSLAFLTISFCSLIFLLTGFTSTSSEW